LEDEERGTGLSDPKLKGFVDENTQKEEAKPATVTPPSGGEASASSSGEVAGV